MYKKNIAVILSIVLLLALFFQYNRTDGFARLLKNNNQALTVFGEIEKVALPENDAARETFIVIYDATSVESVFLKKTIENVFARQKKAIVSVRSSEKIDWNKKYSGVIIATKYFDKIVDFSAVVNFVSGGGRVVFAGGLEDGSKLNSMTDLLGVKFFGSVKYTIGINFLTNFVFGSKGMSFNIDSYTTAVKDVTLSDNAKLHITSGDGIPIVWENDFGAGKVVVYNGSRIFEKINRGLLVALISKLKTEYIYPIMGFTIIFIDDFPSPEPEGIFDKIYKEYHLTTSQFYRQVWWPDMLSFGKKYNIKYTGMIIESYNNQVKPPFTHDTGNKNRDNLIIYGRELLKAGGELGIHGYNHQSLAPPGYAPGDLGYNAWESQEHMVASLNELKRYIEAVYPGYEIRAYVPPSNVLSSMGKEAVKKAFPNIRVFSSLYDGTPEDKGYYQNFSRNTDGTFELPRITSGFILSEIMKIDTLNIINSDGVISHFVHPDELFYETTEASGWKEMSKVFEGFLKNINERYGWMTSVTASEAIEYMDEYFNLDYEVVEGDNALEIRCSNIKKTATFILRTEKSIDKSDGCKFIKVDENVYAIKMQTDRARIVFKGGSDK